MIRHQIGTTICNNNPTTTTLYITVPFKYTAYRVYMYQIVLKYIKVLSLSKCIFGTLECPNILPLKSTCTCCSKLFRWPFQVPGKDYGTCGTVAPAQLSSLRSSAWRSCSNPGRIHKQPVALPRCLPRPAINTMYCQKPAQKKQIAVWCLSRT